MLKMTGAIGSLSLTLLCCGGTAKKPPLRPPVPTVDAVPPAQPGPLCRPSEYRLASMVKPGAQTALTFQITNHSKLRLESRLPLAHYTTSFGLRNAYFFEYMGKDATYRSMATSALSASPSDIPAPGPVVTLRCDFHVATDLWQSLVCVYRDRKDPTGAHDRLHTLVTKDWKLPYRREAYSALFPEFGGMEVAQMLLDDVTSPDQRTDRHIVRQNILGLVRQKLGSLGILLGPSREPRKLEPLKDPAFPDQGPSAPDVDHELLRNYFVRDDGLYFAFMPSTLKLSPSKEIVVVRLLWNEIEGLPAGQMVVLPVLLELTKLPTCNPPRDLAEVPPLEMQPAAPPKPPPAPTSVSRPKTKTRHMMRYDVIAWDRPRLFHHQKIDWSIEDTDGVEPFSSIDAFIEKHHAIAARTIDEVKTIKLPFHGEATSDIDAFCRHDALDSPDRDKARPWFSYSCHASNVRGNPIPKVDQQTWNGFFDANGKFEPVEFGDLFRNPSRALKLANSRALASFRSDPNVAAGKVDFRVGNDLKHWVVTSAGVEVRTTEQVLGRSDETVLARVKKDRGTFSVPTARIPWDLMRHLLKPRYRALVKRLEATARLVRQ